MMSSSSNATQSPNVTQDDLENVSHYLYMIIYPIIFLFGIIGNLLSSLLFSITNLNRTSCGIYFLLLAIADSTGLIAGLHHCLTIGFDVTVPNAIYCRVRNFLLYVSMDLASWMIVAISVDRFLKVKFPIKAGTYTTRKISLIISCTIIVVLILENMHLATIFIGDFSENAADNCNPNPNYPTYVYFFNKIWPWIDFTTFAALPFLIVSISNGFIIYEQYNRRVKLRNRHLDRTFIILLLTSSMIFILCNLPITILGIIYPYVSSSYDTNDMYDKAAFAYDILRLPSYGSLALNFYLYYYTSNVFRQQAILLLKRIFRRETPIDDDEIAPIDQSDEYSQTSRSSTRERSFILNYYRQENL